MGLPNRLKLACTDLRYYGGQGKARALTRAIYHTLIRGCETEMCQDCGRPVKHSLDGYWRASDELWNTVVGEPGWREQLGEYAYLGVPGTLCPRCFYEEAERRGLRVAWLAVSADEYDAHARRDLQVKIDAGEYDDSPEDKARLEDE